MTVEEYKRYKNDENIWYKAKIVKQFWDTNPTYEQEYLRGKNVMLGMYWSVVCGILIGIGITFIGVGLNWL